MSDLNTEWNRCVDVLKAFGRKVPYLLKELYMVHKIVSEAEGYIVTGTADDNAWVYKNREFIEEYARDEMRNQGLIPVLDGVSNFSVSFDAETEKFSYEVTIPGYRHGKANEYVGILAQQALLISKDMEQVSVVEL